MKKLIKNLVLVLMVVTMVSFGLLSMSEKDVNITMDFHNSGQPEWSDEIFIEGVMEGVTVDFHNSGQPEWSDEIFIDADHHDYEMVSKRFNIQLKRNFDFKNSGLPETIEFTTFLFI